MGVVASQPAEEEEMYILVVGFIARMRKRAAGSKGEAASNPGGKRPRRSSPDEEAQKDWAIILVDSPVKSPSDQPTLEGAPNEAGATLKEGVLVARPLDVD